jgi:hypothetical protein
MLRCLVKLHRCWLRLYWCCLRLLSDGLVATGVVVVLRSSILGLSYVHCVGYIKATDFRLQDSMNYYTWLHAQVRLCLCSCLFIAFSVLVLGSQQAVCARLMSFACAAVP